MKKIISLLSLVSLFSLAVACNQNDRQDEEVKGMETTDERMDQTEDSMDIQGTDQRMEDSTFQDNRDQLNEDNQGTEGRVEEGVNP